jgi:CRP-like cAMP-binding protein
MAAEGVLRCASATGRPAKEAAREIILPRGEVLFFEGDKAEYYFEVLRGTIRCCRLTPDGRRQIYRFAGTGQLLAIGCVRRYGYSAEAVTEVAVRRQRLAALDPAMAVDGNLRRRVVRSLQDELAATRTQMLLLGRMSAAEKLGTFLRSLAGDALVPGSRVELPMTRSDIADYLGLTIETVSRKLNEMQGQGIIRLEGPGRVTITDPGRIEALAEVA